MNGEPVPVFKRKLALHDNEAAAAVLGVGVQYMHGVIELACRHPDRRIFVARNIEDKQAAALGIVGGHIDQDFREAGLETDIVLTAMDSDVIRQYVSPGLGVGIVAEMAMEHNGNHGLPAIGAKHLFAPNVTRIAVRRGAYPRSYI